MSLAEISSILDFFYTPDQVLAAVTTVAQELGISVELAADIYLSRLHEIIGRVICYPASYGKKLKLYQETAALHMLGHRGLIAAFEVGTGKTLTAVVAAKLIVELGKFLNQYSRLKITIITPASLVDNMKDEYKRINHGFMGGFVDPYVNIMTIDTFGSQLRKNPGEKHGPWCENSFLIVDEGHCLKADYLQQFNEYPAPVLENTNAEQFLKCAKSVKRILILTATTHPNRPHDIANLISAVHGYDEPTRYYYDFRLYRENIMFQESNPEHFPGEIHNVLEIPMEFPNLGEGLGTAYIEQYSNFERILDQQESKKKQRSPIRNINDIPILFKETEKPGVSNAFLSAIRQESNNINPCFKCLVAMAIILQAKARGQKTIFYSEFLSSGIERLIEWLQHAKIGYLQISGAIDKKKRSEIVKTFNNTPGFQLIILTKAGGVGLDLMGVENVILMEPSWNLDRLYQVIGRGSRYRSHKHLPPERQFINIYYLLMVKNSYIGAEYRFIKNPLIKPENTIISDDYVKHIFDKYSFKRVQIDSFDYTGITLIDNPPNPHFSMPPRYHYQNKTKELDAGIDMYMLMLSFAKHHINTLFKRELEKVQLRPGRYGTYVC